MRAGEDLRRRIGAGGRRRTRKHTMRSSPRNVTHLTARHSSGSSLPRKDLHDRDYSSVFANRRTLSDVTTSANSASTSARDHSASTPAPRSRIARTASM